jgi:hypothetical protein
MFTRAGGIQQWGSHVITTFKELEQERARPDHSASAHHRATRLDDCAHHACQSTLGVVGDLIPNNIVSQHCMIHRPYACPNTSGVMAMVAPGDQAEGQLIEADWDAWLRSEAKFLICLGEELLCRSATLLDPTIQLQAQVMELPRQKHQSAPSKTCRPHACMANLHGSAMADISPAQSSDQHS